MQKLGSDIVAPLHVTCLGNLAALKLLLPPPPSLSATLAEHIAVITSPSKLDIYSSVS